MKIQLITPAPPRFNNGNKITAVRWLGILRKLGHRVDLKQVYDGRPCDALIALHAQRSHESIQRFHELYPGLPLVVVLTGTDLYRDIRRHRTARRSLRIATRVVVLQQMALAELAKPLREKTRVIYQSAAPIRATAPHWDTRGFRVCVIGHLRKEKDPLRAALAARRLPAQSRIEILHIGRALDQNLAERARREAARNPRYQWMGELSHGRTRRLLARSHLAVISSSMEGSSNVLSEAIASSVPVLATKIPGLIGTLGKRHPGYFPVGDTRKLTALLERAESDHGFYVALKRASIRVAPLIDPARELRAWRRLVEEFPE